MMKTFPSRTALNEESARTLCSLNTNVGVKTVDRTDGDAGIGGYIFTKHSLISFRQKDVKFLKMLGGMLP